MNATGRLVSNAGNKGLGGGTHYWLFHCLLLHIGRLTQALPYDTRMG